MRNSGIILRLQDDRVVIVYNKQPLIKQNKIILNLVDEKHNKILDDKGNPKVLLKSKEIYQEEILKNSKLIGYID